MTIAFDCERCGQHFEVDESLADTHGHCKNCGLEMNVPSAGSSSMRSDDAASKASDDVAHPTATSSAHEARKELAGAAHAEKSPRRPTGDEDEDDGKPYEFDQSFEPPASAIAPSSPPLALMEARAGWRHAVRAFTKKLSKFEDAIYLTLMAFWLIGAVAFLFEQKHLVWTMLGLLVVCSVLLSFLGGFEIFIKPFEESLRHGLAFVFIPPYAIYYIITRWDRMKRPLKKASVAFGPLIVLLLLALFSRPIRDWYLHSPPKDKDGQAVAAGESVG